MIAIKVVVYCSILIKLSTASEECTSENPLNCKPKHKIGVVDVARENQLLRELIEQKAELGRMYEFSDLEKYLISMKHEWQEIPTFFDAREKWSMCESISRIKNQGDCGTCWAFTGGMVASDRLCIASGGHIKFDVSQQHIITCCPVCFSDSFQDRCLLGSSTASAFAYMIENEVVDEECKPYDPLTIKDECQLSCKNEAMLYNKVHLNMSVIIVGITFQEPGFEESTLEDIQIEIMKHGPVGTSLHELTYAFAGYEDEVYINNGPWSKDDGTSTHAVRVIGWGIEYGIPYWLCANTWGQSWGKLGGVFKIRRGTNEYNMESMFLAIGPKSRLIKEDKKDRKIWIPEYDDPSSTKSFTKTSHIFVITIVVIVLNF